MNLDRFQFAEPDMTCPECGQGPDECDAAYYADVVCELAFDALHDDPAVKFVEAGLHLLEKGARK